MNDEGNTPDALAAKKAELDERGAAQVDKEAELDEREAALAKREAGQDAEDVATRGTLGGQLAADDPRAGTIDDPSVVDPYAHLRKPEADAETEDDQ